MVLAEVLKIAHTIREMVINGAQPYLLADAIHDLYTLRRKRGKSNGDGIKNGYPTNGNHHRPSKVSVVSYLCSCSY